MISPFLYVDANLIAEKSKANVLSIELNPYSYCERLTAANSIKDKRVRYSWTQNLNDNLSHWRSNGTQFQGFVATELLLTADFGTIRK